MSVLQGKRVLFVEDEPIVAMTVEDILEELKIDIVGPAGTIEHALALVEREAIDAGLLDVNIHGERSYSVAEALTVKGIPVVFATGYGESGWSGAPDAPILDKPYNKTAIAEALTKALRQTA